ncbi:slit3 protein-like [Tropilaelaps mercedesae]|uniref:Slit3 protein-like n=1 Tax=Tropilaelaps mercedesae TaxID=418985 RepID=A0A1V9X3F4_9ACAR|nr:slit3 protein-like [Tropilaelaps mercedesae]
MDKSGVCAQMTLISVVSAITACTLVWFNLQLVAEARYVQPEDCTWEPMSDSAGVSMACSLTALQGEPDPTNFSLIMLGHTVRLLIRCAYGDAVPPTHSSELASGFFEHLIGLESLNIEQCKLDYLPPKAFQGLSDLKHLTVRTFNTDRNRFSLRLLPTSFLPLAGLESLDLSENNIGSLPHALLCGLNQLRFVNFTRNKFSDVVNMGLSSESRCSPAIRELEVAHNRLKLLSDRGFASLPHLEELRLDHNQITHAESSSLSGLTKLERFDITHNVLVSLPATLFRPTPKLSELYLRNNSLNALPPDLFTGLNDLTMLDLAHNQLSSLGWLGGPNAVAHLAQLRTLDLSHNQLTRLESGAFRALVALQTIQLQDNLIEHIANDTFRHLNELQSLVLSNNRLQQVGPRTLVGPGNSLMTLQLDKNRVKSIHKDAFRSMLMLQELNLAGNKLSTVPHAVSALSMLRSLDLSDNDMQDVANASYQDLRKLYALNLMGNKIGNISRGAFNGLLSVRILNLARNGIQAVEEGTFDDLPGLHYLRMDSNIIDDVNGLFSNLHDLIMLNISVNRVRWFDYALIPVGLQWLDIHDNQIEVLGNYFELEHTLKLRTLDASYNKLTDLDSSSLPNGIEIVFLKHNNLRRIQPFTFLGKQNLTRVDLTNNLLQVLEMTMFRLSDVSVHRPVAEFAMAGNPYLCDCRMGWIQHSQNLSLASSDSSRQYPRIVDLHSVECKLSFSKNVDSLPLVEVEPAEFLCEYKSHCFALCHCCDFDECDCDMICPDNCTCYHNQSWDSNIVDCSARHRIEAPKQLPMTISEMYLDGNNIPVLRPESFINRSKLEVLFLNNSNVAIVHNRSFVSFQKLRVLRLDDNQILTFSGREFDGLTKLEELYLSNNMLSYVSNITFAQLAKLKILYLHRNRLVEMSLASLRYNPRLNELRLAGNPWTCSCHFTEKLAQFLYLRSDTVQDIFQLTCVHNETTLLQLWELNVTECYRPSETTLPPQFQLRRIENLPVLIIIGAISFPLVTVTVLIAKRRMLSVWFFNRCGVRIFHRARAEEEKLFDVFVSYSKKDEAFVAQILAPELECCNPPYRLCLHYRDLPVAGTYLSEAIQEAVESS